MRGQGLAAAAADIAGGRRRELHPLGARRLRAWLLIDGPVELPGPRTSCPATWSRCCRWSWSAGTGWTPRSAAAGRRCWSGWPGPPWTTRSRRAGWPRSGWPMPTCGRPRWPRRATAAELAADLLIALPDALVRVVGDLVEVAVPLDADLPRVLATLAADRPAGIGIGVRPGALAVSLRQARSALPASRVQGRHVHAGEIASSRLLLGAVGAPALQAYADAVLGPLDATDRAGELVRALTAFLEHNGHWGAAAAALRVHRHTMRNRIDAVERLTGRRMESAQDRHELWLALRARESARSRTLADSLHPAVRAPGRGRRHQPGRHRGVGAGRHRAVPVLRSTALIDAPPRTVAGLLRDVELTAAALGRDGHRIATDARLLAPGTRWG